MSRAYASPRARERYDRPDRGRTPPSYTCSYPTRSDGGADEWAAYRERERVERAEYDRYIAHDGERIRERSPPRRQPVTSTQPKSYISRQSSPCSTPPRPSIFRGFGIYIHFGNMYCKQGGELVNYIKRHGGITISDPTDSRVTHIIIDLKPELPSNLVLSIQANIPSKEKCARYKDWNVEELVKYFARVKGANQYRTGSVNGRTVLLRQEWLRDSVRAGKALGQEEGYGGWEVRGTYDPRLITPIPTSSSSTAAVQAPSPTPTAIPSSRPSSRAYNPRPPVIRCEDNVPNDPPTPLFSPVEEAGQGKRRDQVTSSILTHEAAPDNKGNEVTNSGLPTSETIDLPHHESSSIPAHHDENVNSVVSHDLPMATSEDHSAVEHQTPLDVSQLLVDRYEPQPQQYYNTENEMTADFAVKEEPEEVVKQEMVDVPQALDEQAQWSIGGYPIEGTDLRGGSSSVTCHREQGVGQTGDSPINGVETGSGSHSQADASTSVDDSRVQRSRPQVEITPSNTPALVTEPFATPLSQRSLTSTPVFASARRSTTQPKSTAAPYSLASGSGSGSGSRFGSGPPESSRNPTRSSSNPTSLSKSKQTGVFVPPLAPPISFHVFESERSAFVELLITETGGGIITTLEKATYILLPLTKGEYATDPIHLDVIEVVREDGWRAVLSENWVKDSIVAKRMVDYQDYIIHPHPELDLEPEGDVQSPGERGVKEELEFEIVDDCYPPTPSASFSGRGMD